MDQIKKPEQNATLKKYSRVSLWLVLASCVVGTIAAVSVSGLLAGNDAAAEANTTAAAEKPGEVYLAYTVNNLGYTATCG